jgi:hypothetical protein
VRNPLSSTNFFSWSTSLANATNRFGQFINLNFNAQYNTSIQICAQCHNARGAQWTDTSSPPHPSLQYNMLLGNVGVIGTNEAPYKPSRHARFIPNQCLGCHMQTQEFQSDSSPAITGHRFTVDSYTLCETCHGPGVADLVDNALHTFLPQQTAVVKDALDLWAATKAPPALYTNYGTRAWEYTNPGSLSPGGPGPTTSEQALIPDNIKKARFNLYLANGDRASGVHNVRFLQSLFNAALDFVQIELSQ